MHTSLSCTYLIKSIWSQLLLIIPGRIVKAIILNLQPQRVPTKYLSTFLFLVLPCHRIPLPHRELTKYHFTFLFLVLPHHLIQKKLQMMYKINFHLPVPGSASSSYRVATPQATYKAPFHLPIPGSCSSSEISGCSTFDEASLTIKNINQLLTTLQIGFHTDTTSNMADMVCGSSSAIFNHSQPTSLVYWMCGYWAKDGMESC